MNIKKFILSFASFSLAISAMAQASLPTMDVAGKKFYYTQVADKETVHGVAQRTGVSIDDILAANPSATDGLTKGQLLLFPVNPVNASAPAPASMSVNTGAAQTYTLSTGESLYTVAKKFNSSVEGLLRNNLNITPDQFVPGTTIKVIPNSAMPFYYEVPDIKFHDHIVKKQETNATIAALYGTDELTIARLNPNVNKLKKGKPITVPRTSMVRILGDMRTASVTDLQSYYSTRVGDIRYRLVEEMRNSTCNVGIILPFQLDKAEAPKQAFLYTDFLKGFMIAMDSIGSKATRKINVKVYDTQHNLNVTDSLLALPQLKQLNFIIAPGEPKQLERINKFGNENNIQILNCFSTKNEDHMNNANALLVNTPTPNMVKNVTEWVQSRFEDCTVVYLEDESSEASEMFNLLKANFKAAGVFTETIKVNGTLVAANVSRTLNPGTSYLFVPSNGNKSLLGKVKEALKTVKEERVDCGINLLGYPEYTLYLKDYQDDLMAIDTYMFSRFFNSKGFRTRNVEASYAKWYNGNILESYPNMVLYGFDTGSFIINTLGAGETVDTGTQVQKGIQTGFKFNHADGSQGLVNQAVTLVHFAPNKSIESFVTTGRK